MSISPAILRDAWKPVVPGLLVTLLVTTAAVNAEEIDQGESLHAQNCTGCHNSSVYTREDRIVRSFTGLKERIRQCELGNDLAWFDEEIEAVAAYLNKNYYHFER